MRADFSTQPLEQKLIPADETSTSAMECSEELDTADDLTFFWTPSDEETCQLLEARELMFAMPPSLWALSQPQITFSMRATLSDWMQEVSCEYGLKRSTFHSAVNLVDYYLCVCQHQVQREGYQLVGIAALLVAAKFEEVMFPKMNDFRSAAGNAFSISELRAMERQLLITLKWNVCIPTLYHWTTWLMTQWDDYVTFICVPYPVFDRKSEASYVLFRKVMHLSDSVVLDHAHLTFPKRLLAAVCLLIALQWDQQPAPSFLADFEQFLASTLSTQEVAAISQAVQYVGLFRSLPLCLNPPKASLQAKVHYFDYLSVQTYVPGACALVKRKNQYSARQMQSL